MEKKEKVELTQQAMYFYFSENTGSRLFTHSLVTAIIRAKANNSEVYSDLFNRDRI